MGGHGAASFFHHKYHRGHCCPCMNESMKLDGLGPSSSRRVFVRMASVEIQDHSSHGIMPHGYPTGLPRLGSNRDHGLPNDRKYLFVIMTEASLRYYFEGIAVKTA